MTCMQGLEGRDDQSEAQTEPTEFVLQALTV